MRSAIAAWFELVSPMISAATSAASWKLIWSSRAEPLRWNSLTSRSAQASIVAR